MSVKISIDLSCIGSAVLYYLTSSLDPSRLRVFQLIAGSTLKWMSFYKREVLNLYIGFQSKFSLNVITAVHTI